ncbi:MAG: DUF3261 domain-containing protein [Pseudomonadota bacterium]
MQKHALIGVFILLLCACAHTGSSTQVRVADAIALDLMPPASFGQSLVLTQLALIEFGEEQYELLFYTEISPTKITIVGTLPNGTRLFSIVYDGLVIQSDGSEQLLSRITPEYFLADLQLTQWPLEAVANSLALTNTCFMTGSCEITESTDHLQRNISRNGNAVISIQYDSVPHYQNSTSYEHHERGYHLNVETLEVQPIGRGQL